MKKTKSYDKPVSKRYSLVLPELLFQEIKDLADKKQESVVDILKRFIKLGLLYESSPNASLILRENDTQREIVLL